MEEIERGSAALWRPRLEAPGEDRNSIWSSGAASRSSGASATPKQVGVPGARRRAHSGRMTTSNKNIVKEFIDRLFTEGDVSVLDELVEPVYVDHDPPFGGAGTVDGWRAMAAMYAEGDIVVERFTASGTHKGEIFGIPPSETVCTLAGINIFRVRDGKIVERWGRVDELGMLRQLGVVPA
jgi:predicted SnoaL-like aldol condensation-catalyzing enzyme